MINKQFTDLEEVFKRLGGIPCLITIRDDGIYGETIVIEAIATDRRKKKLEGIENETSRKD